MLAMDAGPVPQQVGAVLLLDAGPDFDVAAADGLLAEAGPRGAPVAVAAGPGATRLWPSRLG
jgi:hypothetical protein